MDVSLKNRLHLIDARPLRSVISSYIMFLDTPVLLPILVKWLYLLVAESSRVLVIAHPALHRSYLFRCGFGLLCRICVFHQDGGLQMCPLRILSHFYQCSTVWQFLDSSNNRPASSCEQDSTPGVYRACDFWRSGSQCHFLCFVYVIVLFLEAWWQITDFHHTLI